MTPQPPTAPACSQPLGPQDQTAVDASGGPADVMSLVSQTFEQYFSGINSGNYEQARLRRSPGQRPSPEEWVDGVSTSYDFDISLNDVTTSGSAITAWITFTSLQAAEKGPRDGETCTSWSIDYTLVPADDGLLWIDGTDGHAGGPISVPCD